jgi:hypothetical protein
MDLNTMVIDLAWLSSHCQTAVNLRTVVAGLTVKLWTRVVLTREVWREVVDAGFVDQSDMNSQGLQRKMLAGAKGGFD